jgi:hypothetical protein
LDVIFTIVSRNYAAQAATLMQSLMEVEPKARRVVIGTDGPMPSVEPFAEVIAAADVEPRFAAMSVYYDALELNTAVKPAAFRRLLGEAASVTYLDPDIYVFRPLEAVRGALESAELALIPHLTRPLAGEAMPNERAILQSGVYNLGFAGLRPTPKALALIDWWRERCRFDCRVDFAAGLFTDQRWMDLTPGFVDELAILRDPALNLAYWSLEGRTVARGPQGWTVDGAPLAFFHFSGFDPARPDVLSKHQDRIRVAPGSALAELLEFYAGKLLANGHAAASATPYAFDRFPSGRPVTPAMRVRALAAARAGETFDGLSEATEARLAEDGGVRRAADPALFGEPPPAAEETLAWLRGSGPDGQARALTALLAARADLRARFAGDREGLLAWALGVEAPAGRFAPDLLADGAIDPAVLLQAARFADPDAPALKQQLSAAFGLARRGRWPAQAAEALRTPLVTPVPGRAAPHIRLFEEIWASRADLQRLFPLRSGIERFRFLRWLLGGGLAEYDVSAEDLPPAVRGHPLFAIAQLSLGGRAPAPAAAPEVAELWVVESLEEAREIAADRAAYAAEAGRFLGPAGDQPPRRAARLRLLVDPALIPADLMALHAQGVRWDRVEVP